MPTVKRLRKLTESQEREVWRERLRIQASCAIDLLLEFSGTPRKELAKRLGVQQETLDDVCVEGLTLEWISDSAHVMGMRPVISFRREAEE